MIFSASLFDLRVESDAGRQIKRRPLFIYGAGSTGISVSNYLINSGFEVVAFLDKNQKIKYSKNGKPVISLQQVVRDYGVDVQILVAIHNRGVDMVEILQKLKATGFFNIFTMFDYVKQFHEDKTFRYFLTDPVNLVPEKARAQKFYELLEDPLSKDIYSNLIKFRLSGDYGVCPTPLANSQYSPPDIPRWDNPLRLIDCGAYDGDSIRHLSGYGYDFDSIIAFEPDMLNYQELVKKINFTNSILLPCGVSDCAKTLKFNSGDGEASRSSEDGAITIQMVAIDEALPTNNPNLIKIDIEGGERDAILDAKDTIKKYRPGIAVSAYHLPFDLWSLGLLISEIEPEYRFYLRSHAYSSFETVLYAMPRQHSQ